MHPKKNTGPKCWETNAIQGEMEQTHEDFGKAGNQHCRDVKWQWRYDRMKMIQEQRDKMKDELSILPEQQWGEPDEESTDGCDGLPAVTNWWLMNWWIDEVWQSWHRWIPKTTEICAVLHFFSKYVCWIDSAREVLNIDGFILHLFPNQIFPKLNVVCSLRSHIVQPLDASIIVIVQKSWLRDVRKIMTRIGDTLTKITKVDNFLWSGVGGSNFSLTRAEGHPVLMVANPTNWATSSKDDTPVHTAKEKTVL
jgi:hypothetical protein